MSKLLEHDNNWRHIMSHNKFQYYTSKFYRCSLENNNKTQIAPPFLREKVFKENP